jgi:catechol 2,3-dioxygenase-like lactoylglutathione lyase family enzyme
VEVDLIRWIWAFIDRPLERFDQAAAFWANVTDTRLSTRRGSDGEFVTLLPLSGHPSLKLQGVHGSGGAHLDLEVDDVPVAIDIALGLGATVVAPHPDWAVMWSPGGQLFCLTPWEGAVAQAPVVRHPDGTSSRLDQLCLDVAPAGYDVEKSFWAELTGWRLHAGARAEFDLLKPPRGLPIRILLQRLGTDRASSAHVDLACSDIEAARSWHEQCGARVVGRWPHWIVMKDPAGGAYCLTARDPETGRLRDGVPSEADPPAPSS